VPSGHGETSEEGAATEPSSRVDVDALRPFEFLGGAVGRSSPFFVSTRRANGCSTDWLSPPIAEDSAARSVFSRCSPRLRARPDAHRRRGNAFGVTTWKSLRSSTVSLRRMRQRDRRRGGFALRRRSHRPRQGARACSRIVMRMPGDRQVNLFAVSDQERLLAHRRHARGRWARETPFKHGGPHHPHRTRGRRRGPDALPGRPCSPSSHREGSRRDRRATGRARRAAVDAIRIACAQRRGRARRRARSVPVPAA
jgi:hypothetical protein